MRFRKYNLAAVLAASLLALSIGHDSWALEGRPRRRRRWRRQVPGETALRPLQPPPGPPGRQ